MRLRRQRFNGVRRKSVPGAQFVHKRQITKQLEPLHRETHHGRKTIGAVVTTPDFAGYFRNRQQLNGVDPEIAQIIELAEYIEKLGNSISTIGSIERADMQLINDQVVEVRRLEIVIRPRVGLFIVDDAIAEGV